MRYFSGLCSLCAATLLLACGQAARAEVIFNLDSPTLTITGFTTNLRGQIQNSGPDGVFLNAIRIDFDGDGATYLTGQDNIFYTNVPGLLFPDDPTYVGPILGVFAAPGTPLTTYSGTVTLLGGADDAARTTLASAAFTLQAANAPEPTALALLTPGLLAGVALLTRRSRN